MKKGFTLIELLVVVLIIGILAAIALPMYQKTVLKSRFAALMPIGKAMAESNEAYYLEHGEYSTDPQDLPVQGQSDYEDGTQVDIVNSGEYIYTIVYNPDKLPDNNYIVFQTHSMQFADTTMCEARDEKAGEVCLALGGTSLSGGVTNGWTAYGLSGNTTGGVFPVVTPPGCPGGAEVGTVASVSHATCTEVCENDVCEYKWVGGRTYQYNYDACNGNSPYACSGSSFPGNNSQYCNGNSEYGCSGITMSGRAGLCRGYVEYSCANSKFIGTLSNCQGNAAYSCANSTFSGSSSSCTGNAANACSGSTFTGRAGCVGLATNACEGATIQTGGYCSASSAGGCDGTIYEGGCCSGSFCPAGSPKCKTVDSGWGQSLVWDDATQSYEIDGTW